MFGDHISAIAQTNDPQFIKVFDHFAIDEVAADRQLDPSKQVMVQVTAITAAQAHAEYRVMAGAALDTQLITLTELTKMV